MHPELNEETLIQALETARGAGETPDTLETGSLRCELRGQQIVNDKGLELNVVQAFDLGPLEWRLVDRRRVRGI